MPRKSLLFALAMFAVTSAFAQYRYNSDYYFDRSDALLREQLKNVELHLGPCVQQYYRRDYARAYADCRFILAYFPNHPTALQTIAEVCAAWRSPTCEIESFFERAVQVNPGVAGPHTIMGVYLLRNGRHAQAVQAFKQALEIDSTSVNAHYNLALAYFDLKQYALANEHAQIAYRLGAPLPGLMNKLKRAGQWNPNADPTGQSADVRPPAAEGGDRSVR